MTTDHKELIVLADEYAAAVAEFAKRIANGDDSMSPIARDAGDKRAVLADAIETLQTEVARLKQEMSFRLARLEVSVKAAWADRDATLTQIAELRTVIQANHDWHLNYDDHDGYPDSELCEMNTAAGAQPSQAPDNHEDNGTVIKRFGQLIAAAERAGLVVTLERRPLQPLAMGHAEYVFETRPVRGKP